MGDSMEHSRARTKSKREHRGGHGPRTGLRAGGLLVVSLLSAALVSGAFPATASADPSPTTPEDGAPIADVSGLSDRLDAITDLPNGTDPGSDAVAAELGVAGDGQGSLQVGDGGVAVSILYSERPDDADFTALRALATVVATSTELARASAYVVPSNLDAVAALPRVASVTEALRPGTAAAVPTSTSTSTSGTTTGSAVPAAASDPCRTVEANGLAPLRADLAAATHGVDGSGVTVGIISDSFATSPTALSTPAQDVAAGLLPGAGNPCGYEHPVSVLIDDPSAGTVDEGRAMAQVVHSIAPGANLVFASTGIDELTFHDAILALKAAGATVIVDDIYVFTEPTFQQGPVGVAIDTVQREGVTYLSSAGNYNNVGQEGYPSAGYAVNGWATDAYRPTTCPAGVLTAMGPGTFDCMDFAQSGAPDATDTLTLAATTAPATYALHWAEPSGFAKGTFVLAVTDDEGDTSVFDRGNGNLPVTAGGFQPMTDGAYHFSIVRDLSAGPSADITPALNWMWAFHGDIRAAEYFGTAGHDRVGTSISGHTGLPSVISVGALPAEAPDVAERFSSVGPAVQYFDFDPAVSPLPQPLAEPRTVAKPDVAGVDRILTNFFSKTRPVDGRPGVHAFWGTSAAAPTVAAVVALGRQYSPGASIAELRQALASTTVPASSGFPAIPTANVVGTGLVDASAFLAALPAPAPTPSPTPTGNSDVAGQASTQLAATGAAPELHPALLFGLAVMFAGAALLGLRARGLRRRTQG